MATQEELNSSLPEGFVRLGRYPGIIRSEDDGRGIVVWSGETTWGGEGNCTFRRSDVEYAVRNTSPMVNLNLERVRDRNPNWRALLPVDWLPPVPGGWLRIGRGDGIANPEEESFPGRYINTNDDYENWESERPLNFNADHWEYIVPDNSPLIQLNYERIATLNPNFLMPIMEEQPTETMFTPLPESVPRPPEGYLIFSNGGGAFPNRIRFDGSQFMRCTNTTNPRAWQRVTGAQEPNSPENWWAVRAGSRITEGQEDRLNFYNPGMDTIDNIPHPIEGIVPEILENPRTPEGWLLMGRGDQLVTLLGHRGRRQQIRFRGIAERSSWERENDWQIGNDREWFACRPTDPFVAQHPEWIAFYNPENTIAGPAQDFRPLEEGLDDVPEGYFIVGHSDDLPDDRGECALHYTGLSAGNKWWIGNWSVGPSERNPYWVACKQESHLYNRARADFYNRPATPTDSQMITSTDTTIPFPEDIPAPREGLHVIGSMHHLRCESAVPGSMHFMPGGVEWVNSHGQTGSRHMVGVWLAIPIDSPHYNPDLAALYPINNITPRIPGPHLYALSVNGTPISSFEELRSVAEPLMLSEDGSKVLEKIWESLEYDNPEEVIESLIEKQPVLMGVIAFHEMEKPTDIMDVTAIAESTRSVGEIITRAAAGALLRGGLSNHFSYTDGGVLQINPNSPPTLDQAHEIIRRTLDIKETADRLDNYSAWTLGMLGDQLETFFGDAFDVSVVMESSKKSYNTYITAVGTYRALWNEKRGDLSFTHHKEVFYAKIDAEQKDWVLDKASELSLSVADTRKLTSYVRNYGTEGLDEDPPETPEALIERVEVKSVNKNYLFFLPSDNKWFEYRGPFERIPNGATPIFNADTRARLSFDGSTQKLETWTPAGIEMPYVRGHAALAARDREEAEAAEAEIVITDDDIEAMEEVTARLREDRAETQGLISADLGEEIEATQAEAPAESRLTNEDLNETYEAIIGEGEAVQPPAEQPSQEAVEALLEPAPQTRARRARRAAPVRQVEEAPPAIHVEATAED